MKQKATRTAIRKKKLKKYVTTVEMGKSINQTAEEIKTEASKKYTTYKYVDDSAGAAETNAKGMRIL